MAEANPLWGAPRIHGELQKLGLEVSQATVSTVPTVLFKVLFVFVVLTHDRRRVLHIDVTHAPTAQWTAQQLVQAFPGDTAPQYLLRDRDAVYGVAFSRRAQSLGIQEVKIAPRAPWQNPSGERLIGTLRRQCLDHVVHAYLAYYHEARTHLALDKDTPEPRAVERSDRGRIVETPLVGGLHHRDTRRAAQGLPDRPGGLATQA